MVFRWLYRGAVIREAWDMQAKLASRTFEVILVKADPEKHTGHKLRKNEGIPCDWYSDYCSRFQSITGRGRKRHRVPTTKIKLSNTERALVRIIKGDELGGGVYIDRLNDIIRERIRDRSREEVRAPFIPEEMQEAWLRF